MHSHKSLYGSVGCDGPGSVGGEGDDFLLSQFSGLLFLRPASVRIESTNAIPIRRIIAGIWTTP